LLKITGQRSTYGLAAAPHQPNKERLTPKCSHKQHRLSNDGRFAQPQQPQPQPQTNAIHQIPRTTNAQQGLIEGHVTGWSEGRGKEEGGQEGQKGQKGQ